MPQQAAQATSNLATTAAPTEADPESQLAAAVVSAAAGDEDDGESPHGGNAKRDRSGFRGVAPLGYQRLLFEHLRQALRNPSSAAAAAAALPWLLQRFCAALRHQLAIAAAGVHSVLRCPASRLSIEERLHRDLVIGHFRDPGPTSIDVR